MAKDACRKRCVQCKRVMSGSRTKMQWCETCGGEMRQVPYGKPRRRVTR